MRKMMLYGKKYGGADPQLIEGDNFRMIISIPEFGENPATPAKIVWRGQSQGQSRGQSWGQSQGQIKFFCFWKTNPYRNPTLRAGLV